MGPNVLGDRDLILSQAQAYITSLGIKLNSDAEIVQRYCMDKPYSANWTIQWVYPEFWGFWATLTALEEIYPKKSDGEVQHQKNLFKEVLKSTAVTFLLTQATLWTTFWISYGDSYPYILPPPPL